MQRKPEDNWSEWLDCNESIISEIPESAGVFMTHSAMKILLIDNAENLQKKLSESLSKPCVSDASRFRFIVTNNHRQKKQDLLEDYKKRHDGNLPRCMK